MSLVVVGSMAFDMIETPFGKSDRIIGGAGTYIAWCASNFTPLKQISVVGGDFPEQELIALKERGVDISGVQVKKEEKTFFWSGKYHTDMNTRDSLVTELNVLQNFQPIVPDSYQDCEYLMLGNLVPAVQLSVIQQLAKRPKLVVLDTMNFWMDIALEDLKKTLLLTDVLMVNDGEARQLSGENSLVKAAKKIMELGPTTVIIKKGEHGSILFHKDELFIAPAMPLEDVFDPTGAGDTFAGGFIGHLAKTGDLSFENMKTAIMLGSVMASFCVEKFGTERLRDIHNEDIVNRIKELIMLTAFGGHLVKDHIETSKLLERYIAKFAL